MTRLLERPGPLLQEESVSLQKKKQTDQKDPKSMLYSCGLDIDLGVSRFGGRKTHVFPLGVPSSTTEKGYSENSHVR